MTFLKKIFCLDNGDNCAIGLCRFNDEMKLEDTRKVIKKRIKKDETLSQLLRKSV